jgi:hypothetical protein
VCNGRNWDTHGDSTATATMVSWLDVIPIGDIVVIGTSDSAGEYEPYSTFARYFTFGHDAAVHDLALREAICLIGRRGTEAQVHTRTRVLVGTAESRLQ